MREVEAACVQVWAVYPRIDIIHANMVWQQKYNVVNYNHVKVRRRLEASLGSHRESPPECEGDDLCIWRGS